MGFNEEVIGTLLLGIFLNTYLYGLVSYQFAAYYRANFNDRPLTKYTVFFLFVLDTFHTAILIYMAWYYTVTNFDNPAALANSVWPYTFSPMGNAFAALATQVYQSFRIWHLTQSKLLFSMAVLLAVTTGIMGTVCGIKALMTPLISEFPRLKPIVTTWLAAQVAADLFIASTLITIFSRKRTGFRKTDSILNRLIRGAVQSSLFAGIFSIGDLIGFAVDPRTNFHGLFALVLGRIYTNTLLDSLLTRETIRSEMFDTCETSTLGWAVQAFGLSRGVMTNQPTSIQIEMQRTAEEMTDHDRLSSDGSDGRDTKAVPMSADDLGDSRKMRATRPSERAWNPIENRVPP